MIHLVRHGESTWNVERRVQGQTPHPPLTARGHAQAAAVAGVLAGRGIQAVVSSDLLRARQTAEPIAAQLGLTVAVDERLREQALGRLEGLTSDESLALVEGADWSDPDLRIGGGESARQVHDRMAAAIASHPGALLVSHGDAIRAALNGWAGYEPAQGPWIEVGSCEVFVLDLPGRWTPISAAPPPPA